MPIIISRNGEKAVSVERSSFDKEDYLQQYIYQNPESIPLSQLKEDIRLLILAREFPTNSGPIDAIGIDRDGDLYIVETKLYKNPDKRTVIAQALDYGAALWKHSDDFGEFVGILDNHAQKVFGVTANEKIRDFFGLSDEETEALVGNAERNLDEGKFKFVVLMDKLEDRLRDLILYVNQNSQFDVYAVELEYYRHDDYEIMIPRIFGAEVKKDIGTGSSRSVVSWDWESFERRLKEFGEAEVAAAKRIIDWASENSIAIGWTSSKRGAFVPEFRSKEGKGFYPLSVTGDATVSWNAPHQSLAHSPHPFDTREKRMEILDRLKSVKGAIVDTDNVEGYSGLRLPLGALADADAGREFLSILLWIKETLESEE
jgi:hypothetical protein